MLNVEYAHSIKVFIVSELQIHTFINQDLKNSLRRNLVIVLCSNMPFLLSRSFSNLWSAMVGFFLILIFFSLKSYRQCVVEISDYR